MFAVHVPVWYSGHSSSGVGLINNCLIWFFQNMNSKHELNAALNKSA